MKLRLRRHRSAPSRSLRSKHYRSQTVTDGDKLLPLLLVLLCKILNTFHLLLHRHMKATFPSPRHPGFAGTNICGTSTYRVSSSSCACLSTFDAPAFPDDPILGGSSLICNGSTIDLCRLRPSVSRNGWGGLSESETSLKGTPPKPSAVSLWFYCHAHGTNYGVIG